VAGVAFVASTGGGTQGGSGSLDAAAADGSGGVVEAPVGVAGFEKGLWIVVGLREEVELCVHESKYGAGV
jgi:hypothetical protein